MKHLTSHTKIADDIISQPLIQIDFLSKKMTYRRQHASLKTEKLARALGLKKNEHPTIIDATAGLGQDSFILACLGFDVILLERSKIIYQFLKEALDKASLNPNIAPIIQRLHLIHVDAINFLPTHSADIIYLDPMFPIRKKSALNKKSMQALNKIVGNDEDAHHLLRCAIACAKKRVVVKRPRLAAPLDHLEPTYSLEGTSNRFDVYLKGTQ